MNIQYTMFCNAQRKPGTVFNRTICEFCGNFVFLGCCDFGELSESNLTMNLCTLQELCVDSYFV